VAGADSATAGGGTTGSGTTGAGTGTGESREIEGEDDDEDDGGAAGAPAAESTTPESRIPESRIIAAAGGGQGASTGHPSGLGAFGTGILGSPSGGEVEPDVASATWPPGEICGIRRTLP